MQTDNKTMSKVSGGDFRVEANSRGYMIYYKGQPIGGAGISNEARAPRGRAAEKQIQDYLLMGAQDVQQLKNGGGDKYKRNAMAKIDAPLTLLVTGSGIRTGIRTNEPSDKVLLLRTEDATLHFDKESDFGKLASALVDNYNNYSKLVEENERLRVVLEMYLEYDIHLSNTLM